MKYIVLLCDGMADRPVEALGGVTPLEAAAPPAMNALAPLAEVGMVKTVPEGLPPGSDVANLSVVGYDPARYYTGRSPLEAANMGVELAPADLALRCNLVTLSDDQPFENKRMVDYCAGDISSAEAKELIESLQAALGSEEFAFYPGVSYRHCLVWKNGPDGIGALTPPHDISGRVIGEHLNHSPAGERLLALTKASEALLRDHPVNRRRAEQGKRPATHIWLWGQGRRPQLADFTAKTGLSGSMISAVDLLKGIARCSGMRVVDVPGATGYIDTNFAGKAAAALAELKSGQDYVYIHVEAPDECGHRGEVQNKVKAIAEIDRQILAPLLAELPQIDDFTLLIMPDHPTPLSTMTHNADPVPFLLYRSNAPTAGPARFTEQTAAQTGLFVPQAHTLIDRMIQPEK